MGLDIAVSRTFKDIDKLKDIINEYRYEQIKEIINEKLLDMRGNYALLYYLHIKYGYETYTDIDLDKDKFDLLLKDFLRYYNDIKSWKSEILDKLEKFSPDRHTDDSYKSDMEYVLREFNRLDILWANDELAQIWMDN